MPRLLSRSSKAKLLKILIFCIVTTIIASVWYIYPHNEATVVKYVEQRISPVVSRYSDGLTFKCSLGELGNRMFYYAVVYGLSKLNNRSGYIQECNTNTCRYSQPDCKLETLDQIFHLNLPIGPKLPTHEQRSHHIHFHITFPDDYRIPPIANMLTGESYPCSVTYFLHVREQVRREFRFRKNFEDYARSVVQRIKDKHPNTTLVGVHVRRSTYIHHLNVFHKQVAPPEFFLFSMQFFRRMFPSVRFLVLSDDIPWCRENLVGSDVIVAQQMSSAANDLAVLSLCQHMIFDYGTYGVWAALLAGGKALYYIDGITDPTEPDSLLAKKMYPPEWVGISNAMLNITV